jgi:hypothetical protein
MTDFYNKVKRLIAELNNKGLFEWSIVFDEIMSGSTGGEVIMGLRYQTEVFLRERPTSNVLILQLVEEINMEAIVALEG